MPAIRGQVRDRFDKVLLFMSFRHKGEVYSLVKTEQRFSPFTPMAKKSYLTLLDFSFPVIELDDCLNITSEGQDIRLLSEKFSVDARKLASVYLYLTQRGVEIKISDLKRIHVLDKDSLQLDYDSMLQTELPITHLDLGERDPRQIIEPFRHLNESHYQTVALINVNKVTGYVADHVDTLNTNYILLTDKTPFNTDPSTWRLLIGFKSFQLNQRKAQKMVLSDSRQLSSLERAIDYVRLRDHQAVRLTLFSNHTNELSANVLHSMAIVLGIDDEDLAYMSLRPKRLLLHFMLAYISVLSHDEFSAAERLSKVRLLSERFITENTPLFQLIETEREGIKGLIKVLEKPDLFEQSRDKRKQKARARLKEIRESLSAYHVDEDKEKQLLYQLEIPKKQVSETVLFYEMFYAYLQDLYHKHVADYIEHCILQGELKRRVVHEGCKQHYIGMTGGVASGKSATEKVQRTLLPKGDPLCIRSDDWNPLLTDFLKLDGLSKDRGMLSLGEAWFIKTLIWDILAKKSEEGFKPHIIQEAMSPLSLYIPKGTKASVYVNTACPLRAVKRMDHRYAETGRYVPVSNTVSSYRNLWLDVLRAINEKRMGRVDNPISLHVIDSDQFYAGDKSPIFSISKGRCDIVSLHRFISFVNRSYMMSRSPRTISGVWAMKRMDLSRTQEEIAKLFSDTSGLTIYCEGQPVTQARLLSLVERRCDAASVIQAAYKKYWA